MIKGYFRVSLFLFLLYNICDVVVIELKMPKYELRDYIEFKMKDDNIYRGNVFAIDQDHLGFFYDVTSIIDDEKVINTEGYKAEVKANEIATLKRYLSDTDYVISKLNELKLEDEAEYEAEKIKYADILKKRKEARVKINELQGN